MVPDTIPYGMSEFIHTGYHSFRLALDTAFCGSMVPELNVMQSGTAGMKGGPERC